MRVFAVPFLVHHRLALLLLPSLLGTDLTAREVPPVKVPLESPATENGRRLWTTPHFRSGVIEAALIRYWRGKGLGSALRRGSPVKLRHGLTVI